MKIYKLIINDLYNKEILNLKCKQNTINPMNTIDG